AASNPNRPKGSIENDKNHWQINANDQLNHAKDYLPIVVSYKNGAAVRISDVGNVVDSVQDIRNAGSVNGKPGIILLVFKQPGSNIIETVERVKSLIPSIKASMPAAVDLNIVMERTTTIKSALHDVQLNLIISIILVILVVMFFLREVHSTIIPSITIPVSLLGTFGIMYLFGYSLDNLSLMAITVATGFVVDDAVVVLENISRHIEKGLSPFKAALIGTKEVAFTVISMSISLIAVFTPILLMGGIVGRLFREFSVTLSVAILVSMVISLTLTPMMCAYMLKHKQEKKHGKLYNISENWFNLLHEKYKISLAFALKHHRIVLLTFFATIAFNIYLYVIVPKSFIPQQDTGRISGTIQADQNISFTALKEKFDEFVKIAKSDPAVANVVGFVGGGQKINGGSIFIILKPLAERKVLADAVIARLRGKLNKVAGAKIYMQSNQDINQGGRQGGAQYQYTLQADNLEDLRKWAPKIYKSMQGMKELTDVNTDQEERGVKTYINYDRDTIYRLGITPYLIDSTLNDAFGQRQVSVIYNPLNQYRVVMEADPKYSQNPEVLNNTYIVSSSGASIPFPAFSKFGEKNTPLSVNHQGQFAATTISFNLASGIALGDASLAIEEMFRQNGIPSTVHGGFQGSAKAFKESLNNQVALILIALLTIYIVLGILYESYIHPITILSTLPSAGVGAILALMLFNMSFSIISFIGVILLIGIVKKNAIMMIDFALQVERSENISSKDAIFNACLVRFRPIMMTTFAALFGALPLAIGSGEGAELRQPLGVAIIGGLIISQILTLYTTPVIYLYLDSASNWFCNKKFRHAIN
ncbi:MAG: efflux RND transporter permease subunit, partial [Pseudomonadota bacterium]